MQRKLSPGTTYGQEQQSYQLTDFILTEASFPARFVIPSHYHENAFFRLIIEGMSTDITGGSKCVGVASTLVYHPSQEVHSNCNASGDFLFAANPKQGRIDVFNDSFVLQNLGPSAFVDPSLPAGLVPFNVDNINGVLYVTYAAAGPPAARNSAPEGVGAVAAFDTSGNFIQQVTSGGKLASPWGITLAPSTFGQFAGDLLVGNFSYVAGEINAYDPVSGDYQGTLADENDNTLLAGSQGLWYLTFGNGGNGGLADTLYFTAGLNAETDGLFGAIIPTPEGGNSQGSNPRASLTNGYVSHSAIVGIQPIGLLGGDGLGSGVFNGRPTPSASPSLKMEASRVVDNGATGGAAANSGSAGQGIGGGIYVTTAGVADVEVPTAIDDVFATFARR